MSKKEVEKNEEGLFKKWLDQTDATIGNWCAPVAKPLASDETSLGLTAEQMPKAPTSFERNLEVWRQLYGLYLLPSPTSRRPCIFIFLSHILSNTWSDARRNMMMHSQCFTNWSYQYIF